MRIICFTRPPHYQRAMETHGFSDDFIARLARLGSYRAEEGAMQDMLALHSHLIAVTLKTVSLTMHQALMVVAAASDCSHIMQYSIPMFISKVENALPAHLPAKTAAPRAGKHQELVSYLLSLSTGQLLAVMAAASNAWRLYKLTQCACLEEAAWYVGLVRAETLTEDERPRITSLQQLCEIVNAIPNCPELLGKGDELRDTVEEPGEFCARYGLPTGTWYDMTSLPVFGGPNPDDTECVWSWDATHLLVGECRPFRIIPRTDA